MAIPENLLQFIKDALGRGIARADIETALLTAGWEREQVSAGLASFAESSFPLPVPRPAPYTTAREAFLYLLLFTTLYWSAYHLGALIIQFITLAFPDAAAPAWEESRARIQEAMRWSVSSIIVAFPLFLYLSVFTAREARRDPARRASRVRRQLTYLTLFVAAAFIIGDLIALLNDLLAGQLTVRFALKVLTVGVIASSLFFYYLRDLRLLDQGPPA
jgi:hypothetical protein